MTDHRFTDAAPIQGARKTADGYLVAEAFVARTGVQLYRGAEVGMNDKAVVRVWRPEEEVKHAASVRGYSHAPVTMGHPEVFVDATNWKDLAKGEVSTEAEWVDGRLRLPLIVKDADTIAAIEGGTRELSAGYLSEIEFSDGITPDGEPYDAIQKRIRINHLAVVPKGRAGSEFRIGDGADARWGASPIFIDRKDDDMADNANRTVLIDGLSVITTDAGAQALEKLTGTIKAKDAEIADAQATHDKAIAAKDAELATKDAKIAELEKAQLTDEALDQRVQDRADLIGRAKTIAPKVETKGLGDAAIRKAAVTAVLGDAAVADKSDAYVEAMFDYHATHAPTLTADPVRQALATAKPTADAAGDHGQSAYEKRLADAWKGDAANKEAV